jgi:hypothetical protein
MSNWPRSDQPSPDQPTHILRKNGKIEPIKNQQNPYNPSKKGISTTRLPKQDPEPKRKSSK